MSTLWPWTQLRDPLACIYLLHIQRQHALPSAMVEPLSPMSQNPFRRNNITDSKRSLLFSMAHFVPNVYIIILYVNQLHVADAICWCLYAGPSVGILGLAWHSEFGVEPRDLKTNNNFIVGPTSQCATIPFREGPPPLLYIYSDFRVIHSTAARVSCSVKSVASEIRTEMRVALIIAFVANTDRDWIRFWDKYTLNKIAFVRLNFTRIGIYRQTDRHIHKHTDRRETRKRVLVLCCPVTYSRLTVRISSALHSSAGCVWMEFRNERLTQHSIIMGLS